MQVCSLSFFYYKVKQAKKNLQKYFHPSSLNLLIYAHVHCAMPRAKKGQQKITALMKSTVLCPCRCYYSMLHIHSCSFKILFKFGKHFIMPIKLAFTSWIKKYAYWVVVIFRTRTRADKRQEKNCKTGWKWTLLGAPKIGWGGGGILLT